VDEGPDERDSRHARGVVDRDAATNRYEPEGQLRDFGAFEERDFTVMSSASWPVIRDDAGFPEHAERSSAMSVHRRVVVGIG